MSLYDVYRTDASLFSKTLEYMPIDSVNEICNDRRFIDFCLGKSNRSLIQWKMLIDSTYSEYPGFIKYLNDVRQSLRSNNPSLSDFNYKVYVNLIKMFDPITQLVILRKKGDVKFNQGTAFNKAIALYILCLQGYYTCNELRQLDTMSSDIRFIQDISIEQPSETDVQRILQISINNNVPILIKLYLPYISKEIVDENMDTIISNNKNIIAELLLAKFPDINLYTKSLYIALIRGNSSLVKYILDSRYTFKSIYNALFRNALDGRNAKSIEYLIDYGMPVTLERIYESFQFIPGLDVLLQHYHLNFDLAQQLLDNTPKDNKELIHTILINTVDKEKALIYAADKGYVDTVSELLNRRANIHYANERALFKATLNNDIAMVKLLLNRGADPEKAWELFTTYQKNKFLPSIKEAYITSYILNKQK